MEGNAIYTRPPHLEGALEHVAGGADEVFARGQREALDADALRRGQHLLPRHRQQLTRARHLSLQHLHARRQVYADSA